MTKSQTTRDRLIADLTWSLDDNGWYATVWSVTGVPADITTIPKDGVLATEKDIRAAVRKKFGAIEMRVL